MKNLMEDQAPNIALYDTMSRFTNRTAGRRMGKAIYCLGPQNFQPVD